MDAISEHTSVSEMVSASIPSEQLSEFNESQFMKESIVSNKSIKSFRNLQ